MKINIFLEIKSGPYGGGNQFLKALKNDLIIKNIYEQNPEKADVILFNSHHRLNDLIRLKANHPEKVFIHRIDGPVFLIRKDTLKLDKLIYKTNNLIADGIIFQSQWSKNKNIELGLKINVPETIITNAPDPLLFNHSKKEPFNPNRKTKIIATSWASNMSKGFDTYKYLDTALNFSEFEMTFCGNSPVKFRNIKHIEALPGNQLAELLKQHDIFITASKNDPCSNSLIEALHCGLPALAYNDGGHPEIIGKAGCIYNEHSEIIKKLHHIKDNYNSCQNEIQLPSMNEVAAEYINFIKTIFQNIKHPKHLNFKNLIALRTEILKYKLVKKLNK
jgi:glycosyltransferase involved in cell wall biosynthesis